MYILEHTQDYDLGDVYRMNDGRSVFVNPHCIGFVDGHPSNSDYYFDDEGGYGCQSNREAAIVYATQHPGAQTPGGDTGRDA